ncbi:MAG: PQQ-dependent sugar dehydrogenase [Chakrabartia sp.]
MIKLKRVKGLCFRIAVACPLPLTACSSGATGASDKGKYPFSISEKAVFEDPWAMAFLPDGRAIITEKAGHIQLWDEKSGQKTAVSGAPSVADEGQGGLGDVAVHPDFKNNRFVYFSWAEAQGAVKGAAVGRARLVEDKGGVRLEGLQVIWRQEPKVSGNGHYGHRLAFGPDGMLYISSGERQKFDPAQDMMSNMGKIVRLTDSGMIPSDNPYYDQGRIKAQIWSLGHRNPLGLAFDAAGRLWESEMGPRGGDEFNLIKRGANYGYPIKSNGSHYDGRDIPDHGAGDGFEAPKLWWNPSISPGSLMLYSGTMFPDWKGDAFIGALGGEALIRIDLNGETAKKAEQWDMGARIREVEQGPDGAIWLLEDGGSGRLLKLTP